MPLEGPVNTISDLNAAWPLGSDPKSDGDGHLRAVKTAVRSLIATPWPSGLAQLGFPGSVAAGDEGKALVLNSGRTAYELKSFKNNVVNATAYPNAALPTRPTILTLTPGVTIPETGTYLLVGVINYYGSVFGPDNSTRVYTYLRLNGAEFYSTTSDLPSVNATTGSAITVPAITVLSANAGDAVNFGAAKWENDPGDSTIVLFFSLHAIRLLT